MRRASTDHSYSRPCFGRKTLRRCRNSEEADDVILIDVDSDHFNNVIIIDVPDSLPKKRQGSSILRKEKNGPLQTVIFIDDDESPEKFNPFVGASSSRGFKPPVEDFEDVDAEENPFIQENVTPVRLSKCKRTYSGKASTGEGYGLNLDSENNSSANDHPDCELMEDISGNVQEQWEKAFYRRKKGIMNDQSGIRSQNGASRIMNDSSHQTVGRKGVNDYEDEGTSPLSEEEDAFYTYVSVDGSSYRGQHSPSIYTEPEDHQYFESGSSSCHRGKRFKKSSSYSSHNEKATKEVKKTKSCFDGNSDYGKASSVKNDVAISKCQNSVEVEADPLNFFPTHEFRESQVTATRCVNEMEHLESCDPYESGSVEKTYNLTSAEEAQNLRQLQKRSKAENGHAMDSVESFMIGEREKFKETDEYKRAMEEEWASRHQALKIQAEEAQNLRQLQKRSKAENGHTMDSVESLIGEREKFKETDEYKRAMEEEWASRHQALKIQAEEAQILRLLQKRSKAENGHTVDSVESFMIGEREKFKETEEYKRAMEEEWASRQQVLKIQAEEAQQLRRLQKRRKAESMRLMDMERRQKERIEEMRSTQKKDEENMNLKEVIRAEVRKELDKLEMVCQNMASLLHSFGIQIEGWPNPSPQEVQTAYKKAVLSFHPDRALRSDTRQQVEAEEKFKLMNRLKEKFSSVL